MIDLNLLDFDYLFLAVDFECVVEHETHLGSNLVRGRRTSSGTLFSEINKSDKKEDSFSKICDSKELVVKGHIHLKTQLRCIASK